MLHCFYLKTCCVGWIIEVSPGRLPGHRTMFPHYATNKITSAGLSEMPQKPWDGLPWGRRAAMPSTRRVVMTHHSPPLYQIWICPLFGFTSCKTSLVSVRCNQCLNARRAFSPPKHKTQAFQTKKEAFAWSVVFLGGGCFSFCFSLNF